MPITPEQQALREAALDLYKPPFKFICGYIQDVDHRTVADDDAGEAGPLRVRGWGRISYLPNAEALQDTVGELIAEALTEYWSRRAQPEAQEAERDKLLAIIASAYQIAGAHDAPEHILDVLADPEAATVEQVEAMLPYQAGAVADERRE